VAALAPALPSLGEDRLIFTLSSADAPILGSVAHPTGAYRALVEQLRLGSVAHPTGAYRALVEQLRLAGSRAPLWIRNRAATTVAADPSFLSRLLDAAILTGALLCDGLGDLISIETESDPTRATKVAYNVLQ